MYFIPLLLLGFISLAPQATVVSSNFSTKSHEAFAAREYFYVGGNYVNTSAGHIFVNQMYVERLTPQQPCQPYPLVFIHGQGQTGTNWLNKPDGNPGWATNFLNHGYIVYIIDQTARGRSAWNPSGNNTLTTYSAEIIEQRFTAPEKFNLYPQAKLHTQWPGTGEMGDPIFDAYYASNMQFLSSSIVQESTMQSAGSALLRKIGPSILVSHSQGGLMPWLIIDSVPELVKAIISIEPKGPPFTEVIFSTEAARKWGLTDIPLTYSALPNGTASDPLLTVEIPNPRIEGDGEGNCIVQAEPARQLTKWKGIPVLVETGEASYHEVYEECTVVFLRQAGVDVEWLRLKNAGIHGNAHLQFMEENSDEVAEVLHKWITKTVGVESKV